MRANGPAVKVGESPPTQVCGSYRDREQRCFGVMGFTVEVERGERGQGRPPVGECERTW